MTVLEAICVSSKIKYSGLHTGHEKFDIVLSQYIIPDIKKTPFIKIVYFSFYDNCSSSTKVGFLNLSVLGAKR